MGSGSTAASVTAASGGKDAEVGGASLQSPAAQLRMVMGLGMCMQMSGLRGRGVEGPMQDTALDWIPYPQDMEHWRAKNTQ